MKYYLIGGGDIRNGDLKSIDQDALSYARNKDVFVVDLTTNDLEKIKKYQNFLKSYFKELGADNVSFITDYDDYESHLKSAGLIYIPGGDTEVLLENIECRGVLPIFKSIDAVVVGNSAGALVLCAEVILTKDEDVLETKVLPGLNLVPFSVDVHYDLSHNAELNVLSIDRDIYAIPENCAIVYDGDFNFIGPVYKFSKAQNKKIN